MANDAIVVFTKKSIDHLLAEGGSASWALNRNNARQHDYVVCVRNAHADSTEGYEPHGSAFLVGRVSDVVPSPRVHGRWLVKFSEYARVNMPNAWKGWRNPVRYTSLEKLGINLSDLHFEPMPQTSEMTQTTQEKSMVEERHEDGRLTIAEAKKGLSLTFGVSPDAIEITIRG
jgi:hypothetical protein